jgi:hypothetical protein
MKIAIQHPERGASPPVVRNDGAQHRRLGCVFQ